MRKILAICALAAAMAGCESSRHGLPCVGVLDDKVPNVKYQVSKRNVIFGLVFSASVLVPGVVILTELECPTGPAPLK